MAREFKILQPCSKKWAELAGEGRTRFCPDCRLHVHALDHYSAGEIDALAPAPSGRLCGCIADPSPGPVRQQDRRNRREILFGAALTFASPLLAQAGRLRIRVVDETGEVVPGAEVSVTNARGKVLANARSGKTGEAAISGLPVGNAKISVASPGFRRLDLTAIVRGLDNPPIEAKLYAGLVTVGAVEIHGEGPAEPHSAPIPDKLILPYPKAR